MLVLDFAPVLLDFVAGFDETNEGVVELEEAKGYDEATETGNTSSGMTVGGANRGVVATGERVGDEEAATDVIGARAEVEAGTVDDGVSLRTATRRGRWMSGSERSSEGSLMESVSGSWSDLDLLTRL